MPNMSYCRFQNTVRDLQDCQEHMDEVDDLGSDEASARERLIEVCKEIVRENGEGE
jgi:hypothetical protein